MNFPAGRFLVDGAPGYYVSCKLDLSGDYFSFNEKVFTLSIIVSQLEEKISILSAEIALRSNAMEKRMEKVEKDEEKENRKNEKDKPQKNTSI